MQLNAVLEIVYMFAATAAIVAGSGQVIRLIRVGRSEQMSIFTWSIWFGSQLITYAYTMILKVYVVAFFNLLWLLLYATVLFLILYYRKRPRLIKINPTETV